LEKGSDREKIKTKIKTLEDFVTLFAWKIPAFTGVLA
jgi:hypothetical protein